MRTIVQKLVSMAIFADERRSEGGIGRRALIAVAALIIMVQAGSAQAATQRPIEDFLDAQGTFCVTPSLLGGQLPDGAIVNGEGCVIFVPPVANFIGWNDLLQARGASIDYAALADDFLGGLLDTQPSGSITERALADGRAEVKVTLHTRNALTWVTDGVESFATDPLLFGNRAPEIQSGAEPALCDAEFRVVFINTAPADPLPDLLQIIIAPELGQELRLLAIRCNATGELRAAFGVADGTPGLANIVQSGLFITSSQRFLEDAFPVERIDLKPVGTSP
jgi:hypothetical protein